MLKVTTGQIIARPQTPGAIPGQQEPLFLRTPSRPTPTFQQGSRRLPRLAVPTWRPRRPPAKEEVGWDSWEVDGKSYFLD